MTKQEAKDLTIEVWTYLRDNPEIDRKINLPIELILKIKDLEGRCPLCEVFKQDDGFPCCSKCPLREPEICTVKGSFYYAWSTCSGYNGRQKYAGLIVDAVKAWEVGDE